jgi:FlaA1/EpsC-like NDP-sugar epimerase
MFIKAGDWFFGLRKRVAVLGWSQAADHLAKSVKNDRGNQHYIIGYISDLSDNFGQEAGLNIPLIGHVSELSEILSAHSVDILIKADSQADVSELIKNCKQQYTESFLNKIANDIFSSAYSKNKNEIKEQLKKLNRCNELVIDNTRQIKPEITSIIHDILEFKN